MVKKQTSTKKPDKPDTVQASIHGYGEEMGLIGEEAALLRMQLFIVKQLEVVRTRLAKIRK